MLKKIIPVNDVSADNKFFIRANSDWNLATYYYAPKDKTKAHTIPILLIHGFIMNHRTFNLEKHSLVPYLTNKNYHVYSIDLRGAGESYHDSKEYRDFNFDDMVSDIDFIIKGILEHYQKSTENKTVKTLHLLGYSLGGLSIFAFIHRFPEKQKSIESIISVAAATDITSFDYKFLKTIIYLYRMNSHLVPYIKTKTIFNMLSPLMMVLPKNVGNAYYESTNLSTHTVPKMLLHCMTHLPHGLVKQVLRFLKGDVTSNDGFCYRNIVSKVTQPVLMMTGAIEKVCPPHVLDKEYNALNLPEHNKKKVLFSKEMGFSMDYCHASIILGKKSHIEVFPIIDTWLQDTEKRKQFC